MDNNIIYTPYLYHICWSKTDMHYIGVEHKSTAHPDNIWTKYFTSSEYVHAYREKHGEPDVIEVRKTFNTSADALQYEHKILTKTDAARSELFLNKSNGGGTFANYGPHSAETKKKIAEANKGKTRSPETRKKIAEAKKKMSAETKKKMSEAHKGKTLTTETKKKIAEAKKKMSAETKKKMSESHKGKTHSAASKKKMSEAKKGIKPSAASKKKMSESQKGRTASAEAKRKMSEAKKGKKRKVTICPHCNKEGGDNMMKRWHFDNCKHKEIK